MQIIFTSTTESWRTLKSEMWSKYRSRTRHSEFVKDSDTTLSMCFPLCSTESVLFPVMCMSWAVSYIILSTEKIAPLVCYMTQAGKHQGCLLKESKWVIWNLGEVGEKYNDKTMTTSAKSIRWFWKNWKDENKTCTKNWWATTCTEQVLTVVADEHQATFRQNWYLNV